MRFTAIRFEQAGKTLYLTTMKASQLLACCHTDEWNPAVGWDLDKQGYQRAPVPAHVERIAAFLARSPNPVMPTGALLSARESAQGILPFTPVGGAANPVPGTLEIPEGRQLCIVDYQHRARGLRMAIEELHATGLADFMMPVIILADVPRYEEIRQFHVINSKQRRIDTDLALALLQTLASALGQAELANLAGPGKFYRIRGTGLTFRLAARTSGPWVGKIAQPHDLPQRGAVIKVKSFVDSLAPVLSKRASCSFLEDEALLDVLTRFWSALEAIVPKSFEDPTSQIQRTVGVYALHIVLARLLYPRLSARGDTSTDTFYSALLPAADEYINGDFWAAKGPANVYVGSSGYRHLARRIMAKL
ncbi:MAG: DGQHR domain-containing protein [Chloroflexota bacterium]|nr:DGQHR domain-containing protein [Chloroflexota bacterium]